MKKLVLLLGLMFFQTYLVEAQIEYLEIDSKILKDTRQVKIQLPRNYDAESKKTYPLIFVFDGDYLFEPVAGVVDYLSYWEEIPDAIVVGINQVGRRMDDGQYDKNDFLPVGTGAQFFDFILFEVIESLKNDYKVGNFSVVVGHDYMANFMNFFLFSNETKFQGYINLSPDIPKGLVPYLEEYFQNTKDKIWYSLNTGSHDVDFLKQKIDKLYKTLDKVDNDLFSLSYKSFENTNHYTLVSYALPFSLKHIFAPYTPVDDYEYDNKLSQAENPVNYIVDKYELINSLYDINIPVRISDIMQVSKWIENNEKWELYQDLSKIAKRQHPQKLISDYFTGRYFEKIGNPKKAIRAYLSGYSYEEAGGLTKEMLLDKADELKAIFGY